MSETTKQYLERRKAVVGRLQGRLPVPGSNPKTPDQARDTWISLNLREEQEEEEKEGGDNRAAFNKEDRTTRKVLSWMETAARAGVLTSVTRTNEEESNCTAMPLPKKIIFAISEAFPSLSFTDA